MNKIMDNYNAAEKALYDHVGFVEGWVVCPIDDLTDSIWSTDGVTVKFAETIEKFESDGDYYLDDVYTQCFYDKWIYEGAELTMIFCNPHTDGVQWFRVFDNAKRVAEHDIS